MNTDVLAGVGAVTRSRVRRRWRELLAIGLVAGLVGGVAIAAFAGARRSSTAYDRLLETSDFPDLFVQLTEPRRGVSDDVADLASVERAVPSVFAVGLRTDSPGQVLLPLQASAEPVADLPLVEGRLPDPSADDEVVLSPRFADELGLVVGDAFSHRALTDDEFADLLRDRWDGSASGVETDVRVVGLVRTPTDVTLSEFPTLTGTAALHDRLVDVATGSAGIWVHLRPGADVTSFERDLAAVVGERSDELFNATSISDLAAERRAVDEATSVLSGGMVVFGVVTALAGAVVLGQMVSRIAEDSRGEEVLLRDLGLDRRARRTAWLVTSWPSLAAATVVALAVAVAASTRTPLGVARSVEPEPGIDANITILAVAAVVLWATVLGVWLAAARAHPRRRPRGSGTGRLLDARGGLHWSLSLAVALGPAERRGGRWLGVAGVATAVAGITAASVFGSSLDDMVDDPARWGWFGELSIEVPEPARQEVYAALDAAPEVDSYAEVRGVELSIEGQTVAAYSIDPRRGDIEPVVLRGRAPASRGEIALGPRLAEQLGAEIGDRVRTDAGERTVVGVAPTFGVSEVSDNVSGALLGGVVDEPGFTTAIVRVADGVDPERFRDSVYSDAEYGVPVVPSEVANMAELDPLPPLLIATFGSVGLVAMAHLARSTSDRSRREVAVLRSLGLSRRHAARIVLGATAGVVLLAALLAVPLGATAAARVWSLVARSAALGTSITVPAALWWMLPVLAGAALASGLVAARRAVAVVPARQLRSE